MGTDSDLQDPDIGSQADSDNEPSAITLPEVTVEGVPINHDPPIEHDPIGQALAGGLLGGPAAGLEGGVAGVIRHGVVETVAALVEHIAEHIPNPFKDKSER
jgi:hypothetical protein